MTYDQVHEALKQVVKESQSWHAESREKLVDWEARRLEMAAKRLHEILFPKPTPPKSTMCPECMFHSLDSWGWCDTCHKHTK